MGIILGLIGAGGSILTIPILVYMAHIPVVRATSYSLIIVGFSACVAAVRSRHRILFRQSVPFVISSALGVFLVRYFIMPRLPQNLGGVSLDTVLILVLLVFMECAGYFMIRPLPLKMPDSPTHNHTLKVMVIALSLGCVMGVLGAGGGFLIIPTLVFFMHMSMQAAVPTSLMIITLNSCVGFFADPYTFMLSDWVRIAQYLSCAILGIGVGLYASRFIESEHLKKSFGYFIWSMGIIIFIREFIV